MKPHKPKPGQSLADLHPELIEEWAACNDVSPWDVSAGMWFHDGSHYRATWICKECGYMWDCLVRARLKGSMCPACIEYGRMFLTESLRNKLGCTRLSESAITYTTYNEHRFWIVDCIIGNTVVEYSNSYLNTRNDYIKRLREKTNHLLQMGYRVVRIREQTTQYPKEPLNIDNPNYFEVDFSLKNLYFYPTELPDELIERVKVYL